MCEGALEDVLCNDQICTGQSVFCPHRSQEAQGGDILNKTGEGAGDVFMAVRDEMRMLCAAA
jgi:hypothetical protein